MNEDNKVDVITAFVIVGVLVCAAGSVLLAMASNKKHRDELKSGKSQTGMELLGMSFDAKSIAMFVGGLVSCIIAGFVGWTVKTQPTLI